VLLDSLVNLDAGTTNFLSGAIAQEVWGVEISLLGYRVVCQTVCVRGLKLAKLSADRVIVVTQRRSVAKSVGCFQRHLFVCLLCAINRWW